MNDPVREQIINLLKGGQAHLTLDDALKDFPEKLRGVTPPGAQHSAWQLLEHLRIAQWDILEFSRDAKHVSPKWPEGYWPTSDNPPTDAQWKRCVSAIKKDLQTMQRLVEDPRTDLYSKIPHGTGQNILREALLIADHNAYHLGVLAVIARIVKSGS